MAKRVRSVRALSGVVAAVVVGAMLAGCSAAAKEPVGLSTVSAKPTSTPKPKASVAPTPAGPADLSDPKLGIEFTAIPDAKGDVAVDAVETLMRFEVEFWKALTSNVVPAGPWGFASDNSLAWVKAQVDGNVAGGWTVSGTEAVSVKLVSTDEVNTVLDVCTNWRDVIAVDGNSKTMTATEAGAAESDGTRIGMTRSTSGSWIVNSHELTGAC